MASDHYDLDELFESPDESGWGGKREGAGRPTKERAARPENVAYASARARNEQAKAELNEMELAIKRREYLPREAFQMVVAKVMSSIAQTLRSLPDTLEAKGISIDVCQQVSSTVDAILQDASDELSMFTSENADES